MKLRKIYAMLMLLVITIQICSTTIIKASEIVNYKSETVEVSSSDELKEVEPVEKTLSVEAGQSDSTEDTISTPINSNLREADGVIAEVGKIIDGTPEWNEEEGPGFDTGDSNAIVRTYDTVNYRIDYSYNNSEGTANDVILRAIAPEGDFTWKTEALIGQKYDITDHGNGILDIRLHDMVPGTSYKTELSLYVGGIDNRNGDLFKPTIEFYIDNTDSEPVTVLDQVAETMISSKKTEINVAINSINYKAGDSSTKDIQINGNTYGTSFLGYELQFALLPENDGTAKGLELPDTSVPLEFNIDFGATKKFENEDEIIDVPLYVQDYGYVSESGLLGERFISSPYNASMAQTSMKYSIRSRGRTFTPPGSFLFDSGDLKVTQTNGEDLMPDVFDREYQTIKVSVKDYAGIGINAENKLRSNGFVPFASGGVMLINPIETKPEKTHTITYTAEVNKNNDASFTDINPDDNVDDYERTFKQYEADYSIRFNTFLVSPENRGGDGYDEEVIGTRTDQDSSTYLSKDYAEEVSSLETVVIEDPRALEVSTKYKIDTDLWADSTPIDVYEHAVAKYGVVDFSQFGDIMDPKYYVGNPGTPVTTAGATENMDPIEQYILSLNGSEDSVKWFDDAKSAKSFADENEGWYFVGYKSYLNLEPFDLETRLYSQLRFTVGGDVDLLENDYTHYLAENYETTFWKTANWIEAKEGANIESGLYDSNRHAATDGEGTGPFGYRKATRNENQSMRSQHPTDVANSFLPILAKLTVYKYVYDENGDKLPSGNVIIPSVDEGLLWKVYVSFNSPLDVTKENPLTVTDTVPVGLELDESSIYPQSDPERGIEVKITTNAEGEKVIQWIFTSNLGLDEIKNLNYITNIDPWAEKNITYTSTATADFYRPEYQDKADASVVTRLREGLQVGKVVNKPVIMPNETDIEYTLTYRNMSEALGSEDYQLYDVFPANTDERNSNYAGTLKYKGIEIEHQDPGVEVKYTFDEGLTNANVESAEFKTEDEWTALGKNIESATAIYVFLPNVPMNISENIKLKFDTEGNVGQDLLVNNFRMTYDSNGTVIPVISGVATSSVPGISKSIGKTEAGTFEESLMLNRGEEAESTETSEADQFVYKVNVMVPKVLEDVDLDPFTVTDQIMPELDILNIKLVDSTGKDVTSLYGDLSVERNHVTYEFNKNLEQITGTEVSLIIDVRVKATVPNFEMYPDNKLPNVANLTYIDEDIDSNIVVAEINGEVDPLRPTQDPDPQEVTITKSVLNKDMEDKGSNLAVNANDEFFYKLDFNTASYTVDGLVNNFTITDQISQELDVLDVILLDEEGNDITDQHSSNITSVDNLVTFNLSTFEEVYAVNKQSFSLLIKVGTTAAKDFSNYPDGKLPNIATLDINGKETETNEVTVEKISTIIKKAVKDEDGAGIAKPGEILTYTLELENDSANDASNVVVRDSMLESLPSYVTFNNDVTATKPGILGIGTVNVTTTGSLTEGTFTIEEVPANTTVTITYSVRVNQIPKDATTLVNVATNDGKDPIDPDTGNPIECSSSTGKCSEAVIPVDPALPVVDPGQVQTTLTKSLVESQADGVATPGEVITYTLAVTNENSKVPAHNVAVRDSMLENLPSYVTFNNDVTATKPGILGIGTVNVSTSGSLTEGNYTIFEVPANTTVTITYSVRVNQIPTDITALVNVATNDGTDPIAPDTGNPIECSSSTGKCSEAVIPVDPALPVVDPGQASTTLTKSLGESKADGVATPGEVITYTLAVTNENLKVPAHNVAVRDSMLENLPSYVTFNNDVNADANTTGSFTEGNYTIVKVPANTTVTITYSVRVNQIPADASPLVNIATNDGTDPSECTSSTSECSEVELPVDPALPVVDPSQAPTTLTKSLVEGQEDGVATPGEVITYSLAVTNSTANAAAHNVIVRDSMLENLPSYVTFNNDVSADANTSGSLTEGNYTIVEVPANTTVTITYSVRVNQIPADASSLVNVATNDGTDPNECTSTTSECSEVELPVDPALPVVDPSQVPTTLTKSLVEGQEDGVATPGEVITYSLAVTNSTANAAAHNVIVRDSMLESLPSYVTFNNDVTATKPGILGIGTVNITTSGSLTEGNYTIFEVPANTTVTITYSVRVNQIPTDITALVNVATNDGTDPIAPDTGNPIECSSSTGKCSEAVIPVDPALPVVDPGQASTTLTKSLGESKADGVATPGEVITYTLAVTNENLKVPAHNVAVRDSMLENLPSYVTFNNDVKATKPGILGIGTVDMLTSGSLTEGNYTIVEVPANTTVTITYSVRVNQIPADASPLVNIATNDGTDPIECTSSTSECSEVVLPVDPALPVVDPSQAPTTLTKSLVEAQADGVATPGEIITYSLAVTNSTANAAAHNVVVRDSMLESLPSYVTFNNDVSADANTSGSLTEGNYTIVEVPANTTVTITYSIRVNQIPTDITALVNIATNDGTDPIECTSSTSECSEVVLPVDPALPVVDPSQAPTTLTKSLVESKADGVATPGEVITYSLAVTNLTANAAAHNVTVRDSMLENSPSYVTFNNDVNVDANTTGSLTEGNYTIVEVPADTTVTITYSITLGQIPADTTAIVNVATNDGTDPIDPDTGNPIECPSITSECSEVVLPVNPELQEVAQDKSEVENSTECTTSEGCSEAELPKEEEKKSNLRMSLSETGDIVVITILSMLILLLGIILTKRIVRQ